MPDSHDSRDSSDSRDSPDSSDYVCAAAWVHRTGRADLIDDVADQFEHPMGPGDIRDVGASTRWPRASRGWHGHERMHPATGRAGVSR